jgi:hypothetical protein
MTSYWCPNVDVDPPEWAETDDERGVWFVVETNTWNRDEVEFCPLCGEQLPHQEGEADE